MQGLRLSRSIRPVILFACSIGLLAETGIAAYPHSSAQSTDQSTASTSTTAKKKRTRKSTSTDTASAGTQSAASTDSSSTASAHHHRRAKTDTSTQAQPAASAAAPASPAPAAPTAASPKAAKSSVTPPAKTASASDIQAARASGKVWVNTETKVYHKDDKWYGATKAGKFMTEQDAVKAGYRPAKGAGSK